MASVYILNSNKLGRYYIGSCLILEERLQEHRNRIDKTSFTAKSNDWELFFSINNLEYKQARAIESHIKKMRSRKYIEDLKRYPEMCQKLIERFK